MARIFPFKALLPAKGLEDKVSANTHVDDLKRQTEIVRNNPLTYLNVVKPYLQFNEEKDPIKHFPYAKSAINELLAKKAMIRDIEDSLYIYIQIDKASEHEYIGLICTVPVEDYYNGSIKVHEKTLTEKEEQLILHIEISGVIGEPVLLTHPGSETLLPLLHKISLESEEIIHFNDEIGRLHRVFRVNDDKAIESINKAYLKVGDLYIADGHHRSAASAGYFKKHNITDGHYLAYVVPPECLKIDSFHRAYKSNIQFDTDHFIEMLSVDFDIQKIDEPLQPEVELEFGLVLKNQWYKLTFNHPTYHQNAVERLDVSILEENVFKNQLHIHDSKTDTQLSFLKGSIPFSELEAEVNAGIYDAIFTVHPCTIQQVFDVADQNLIMPPKSTYIEPKLRTGLTVQVV